MNVFFTVKEAAQYLGLSKSWLDKLRRKGEGPAYFRFGRAIRYKTADLEAWAKANRGEVTE